MPEQFSEAWEYYTPNEEVAECVYLNHVSRSKIDAITDGRLRFGGNHDNQGLQFSKNPNHPNTRLAKEEPVVPPAPEQPRKTSTIHLHPVKACLVCGLEFTVYDSSGKLALRGFCSQKCQKNRMRESVKVMYLDGITLDAIAERLEVCRQTIQTYVRTIKGLPRRKPGAQKGAVRPNPFSW